jgi:hypothetical protein
MSTRIEQRRGPIKKDALWYNSDNTLKDNEFISKIAIQVPYNQIFPLKKQEEGKQDFSADIRIQIGNINTQSIECRISPENILEYSGLKLKQIKIFALKELPSEALLDVLIEDQE